ncbi:energy transducer TonB [Azospirillum sp. TSH100]|uniref:energy transducer TonB n=1 Tax=Azospirillum sp. TSH100 TaxID=652764 RepID=UPI000D646A0D|nr:energy transducer TonB [Azospirillum sp. TSH100]QCG91550.1 energy transducer TonB [Azospirillum sp. TSH100]
MSAAFDHGIVDWSAGDDERPARGAFRWGGALMLALGVHAAAGVAMVAWHVPVTRSEAEPPAVLLELAPLPVTPPEPPPAIDIPLPEPMPEPVIEPPPPEPEPVVEEPPPPPEPPPVVEPEVVLPKPPPEPPKPKPEVKKEAPKPKPEKPKPPRPVVAQPVQQAPVAAPPAPAPAPAAAAPAPSRAVPTWQGRLLSHLERHKRYPRAAQARRQEGVAQVRFVIDREGNVLSVQLDRSSGVSALDEETVEMVRRASPLPAPPEEMAKDRIELVVPVQFFIR